MHLFYSYFIFIHFIIFADLFYYFDNQIFRFRKNFQYSFQFFKKKQKTNKEKRYLEILKRFLESFFDVSINWKFFICNQQVTNKLFQNFSLKKTCDCIVFFLNFFASRTDKNCENLLWKHKRQKFNRQCSNIY